MNLQAPARALLQKVRRMLINDAERPYNLILADLVAARARLESAERRQRELAATIPLPVCYDEALREVRGCRARCMELREQLNANSFYLSQKAAAGGTWTMADEQQRLRSMKRQSHG